jgi:hypothetical protein
VEKWIKGIDTATPLIGVTRFSNRNERIYRSSLHLSPGRMRHERERERGESQGVDVSHRVRREWKRGESHEQGKKEEEKGD